MISQGIQRVDSAHFAWVCCVSARAAARRGVRGPADPHEDRRSLLAPHAVRARDPHRHRAAVPALHRLVLRRLRRAELRQAPPRVPDHAQRPDLLLRTARRREVGAGPARRHPEVRAARATGSSSARRTCARRRTPTRTSTTCCPSTRPARTTSRWTPASRTPTTPRMPKDLARPQLVILSGVWNDWSEPNDSRKFGSTQVEPGPAPRLLPARTGSANARTTTCRSTSSGSASPVAPAPPRRSPPRSPATSSATSG